MTLECPECGVVRESKNWQDCGERHQAVGMYQVLDWCKYGKRKLPIENKGVSEEKKDESLVLVTISDQLALGTL